MHALSIVVPVWNEEKNIILLVERIDMALKKKRIQYEIIFVDDHSTDATISVIESLSKKYPLELLIKEGKKGKAYSLIEGFRKAKYQTFAMIDADLQYPPEALPCLLEKINGGADIVVANRMKATTTKFRQFVSKAFRTFFGKFLFGLDYDVQAGLKVFTKEAYELINVQPRTGWAFDLEFIIKAKQAGFIIENYDILFEKRQNGKSKISFIRASFAVGFNALQVKTKKISPIHIPPSSSESMRGAGIRFKKHKYITHTTLHHSQSAVQTFMRKQIVLLGVLSFFTAIGFLLYPLKTLQAFIGILSLIYFIDVLFNLFLILKSLHVPQEITATEDEIAVLTDSSLPLYTILCPLYREAHVIPQFLQAIKKIDWPKNKLDVMLLLEEDDKETIEQAKKMDIPSFVRIIVVPHSLPKTKPKACNYGLSHAKGEYLVIYDAEDIPDPLQLKKAYLGFQKVGKKVLCLQAKLNYYNPNQNLLTRLFTAEYSLWFDVTLTGLQSIGTSIPLGGTSNHFRTADLVKLEGWDPFNVTEDADIGIRLFKAGYQTAMIDSVTMEEANSKVGNWIRQRSRWIKGYMQTYLVHTRDNISFFRKNGWHAFIFHLTIGGKIAFILINPFLWIMTISYFTLYAFVGSAIESLYPSYIFYMAAFSLVCGNFLFLYYYMIGCVKREQWNLIKYVYLVPLYWIMISISGFMALYQLIFKPHYWEKTVHGLHLQKKIEKEIAEAALYESEGKNGFIFSKRLKKYVSLIMQNKKAYIGGFALITASMIANLLNFFFNAYLGRYLDLSDFAEISLIGGLLSAASILFGAFTTAVNYKSGFLVGQQGDDAAYTFWRKIRRLSLIISIFICIFWVLITPWLTHYFTNSDILLFLLFGIVLLVGFANGADRGFLSAKLMFGSLAAINLLDPIIRMITAVSFVSLHIERFTYAAIPFAIFGTFVLGFYLVVTQIKLSKNPVIKKDSLSFPKKFFTASIVTGFASIVFTSADIILANHFLLPQEAGKYALLTLVGKMVYFLGGLTTPFIIPLISRNEGAKKDSKETLNYILFFTSLLAFVGFFCFGLFGWFSIPILYGKKALSIVPYLIPFTLGMLCFTVSKVLSNYYLVKKQYTFTAIAVLLGIVQITLIFLYHKTFEAIAFDMTIIWTAHLIIMGILHLEVKYVQVFENNFNDLIGLFYRRFTNKRQRITPTTKRILIFNWRDTKHRWAGGAEIYIHEIAKRWVVKGHDVTIFCGNDGKHPRNQIIDGVTIVRRGGFYTVYVWAVLYYLLKFRNSIDYIIDSENGIPFFTPLFSKKPIYLLIHHIHQEVFRNQLRFPFAQVALYMEGKLMPYLYRNKAIITVSESSKNAILQIGLARSGNIQIIHPGIDSKKLQKGKKTKNPSIVYLGRLKPYKSIDVAIKAFASVIKKYPDAIFIIAGEGESGKKLKRLTSILRLEEKVIFLGVVSEERKIQLFSEAWIVVQPSMIEGWGITVIEANACGTPVIASNVNGLKDSIIHGKTGLLVHPQDVAGFADAMLRCLREKDFLKKISHQAYLWSQDFSWDKSADDFDRLFPHVVHCKGGESTHER